MKRNFVVVIALFLSACTGLFMSRHDLVGIYSGYDGYLSLRSDGSFLLIILPGIMAGDVFLMDEDGVPVPRAQQDSKSIAYAEGKWRIDRDTVIFEGCRVPYWWMSAPLQISGNALSTLLPVQEKVVWKRCSENIEKLDPRIRNLTKPLR